MTVTRYIVVNGNGVEADLVARLLDAEYTLVTSWVTKESVHHILSKTGVNL